MTGIDLSFDDLQANLVYDDVLLHLADKEGMGEYVRIWESPLPFIVLGRTCKEKEDLCDTAIRQDQVPVFRRSSGGGTVVQGQGCYNFSFILSKEKYVDLTTITGSYVYLMGLIADLLKPLGVDAVFQPISDLAVAASLKKFSGNAQKRGKHYVLHHGTLLYDFDLSLIPRYLAMPQQQPVYRQARDHLDFVTNIDVKPMQVKGALAHHFGIQNWRKIMTEQEKVTMQALEIKRNYRIDV